MNNLSQRNQAERRFKTYGFLAVLVAITFLFVLLFNIFSTGISAFKASYIGVNINLPAQSERSDINPRKE